MIEREALVAAIMAFLAGQDAHTLDAIRESLEREVDEAGPHALAQLSERFAVVRVGRPFEARLLRELAGSDRRLMMEAAGLAIAALLPPEYQGGFGDEAADLEPARRVLRDLATRPHLLAVSCSPCV
jgi:hypothetical protein